MRHTPKMSAERNHAAHSATEKRLKSSGGLPFAYRTASKTPQRSANGKKNSIKGFSAHAPAKSNCKSAAIIRVVPQEGHSTPKTLRTRHGGRRIYKTTSTAAAPKTAAKARSYLALLLNLTFLLYCKSRIPSSAASLFIFCTLYVKSVCIFEKTSCNFCVL